MTYDEARVIISDALTTMWDANYSTYKLVHENHEPPNLASHKDLFADINIVYNRSEQLELAKQDPRSRFRGAVILQVYVKKGQGTKLQNEVMQSLTNLFKTSDISGIIFQVPAPLTPTDALGWHKQTLRAPFYFVT